MEMAPKLVYLVQQIKCTNLGRGEKIEKKNLLWTLNYIW